VQVPLPPRSYEGQSKPPAEVRPADEAILPGFQNRTVNRDSTDEEILKTGQIIHDLVKPTADMIRDRDDRTRKLRSSAGRAPAEEREPASDGQESRPRSRSKRQR
jgi:hypothetical protein